MTPTLAAAIGGLLMVCAGIVAMAASSNCPRRWRIFPGTLVATGSLYGSDRLLQFFTDTGYLEDARGWVIVVAMVAALGTVCLLAWMITHACPKCHLRVSREKFG